MGPAIDPLPSRQAWEEPPAEGWVSHLGGLGVEILTLAGCIAAALAAWRLHGLARRLGAEQVPGGGGVRVVVILLWCLVCLLAASLVMFVWRRLGGLALVGAMLTDHGRVARLGGRPPIWLDQPPGGPNGAGSVRLAHLTDLHLTEGDHVRMAERPIPGGNRVLLPLLSHPQIADTDLIVMTGDITDRGTAQSWTRFLDLVTDARVRERVVLVPGNHDLGLIDAWGGLRDPEGHWRRNDRFGIVQLANLLKFCQTFAATGGGKLGYVLREREAIHYHQAWAETEQEVRPLITALPQIPVPRVHLGRGFFAGRRELGAYTKRIAAARGKLLALFPVAVPVPGTEGVLFVLNSCTPVCHHPATNGLGWVGRAQYRRLDRLASLYPQTVKLVALHHHVVRRIEEQGHDLVSRIMAKFTVLGDASPLMRFCRRHNVRAVMNGHRHLSYELRLPNGTVLMAAPSSTLGDELAHDTRPQFHRYELADTSEEPTVGIYRQVVRLAGISIPRV